MYALVNFPADDYPWTSGMVAQIDEYYSMIWTERYSRYGDFELVLPCTAQNVSNFRTGRWIVSDETKHCMLIETVNVITDTNDEQKLYVTGRDMMALLQRRIIWDRTNTGTDLQNAIVSLIDTAFSTHSIAAREWPNIVPGWEEKFDGITVESHQYTGTNLYDAVVELLEENGYGMQAVRDDISEFIWFHLINGVDHSATGSGTKVIFSPDFENLKSSDYLRKTDLYKNVALVAGEGEGDDRKRASYGSASGMNRRELFVDARDISSKNGEISDANYLKLLRQRGRDKLREDNNKVSTVFSAEVDMYGIYKLGTDFNLGDIVQVDNGLGISVSARIIEITKSHTLDGLTYVPTLEVIE